MLLKPASLSTRSVCAGSAKEAGWCLLSSLSAGSVTWVPIAAKITA